MKFVLTSLLLHGLCVGAFAFLLRGSLNSVSARIETIEGSFESQPVHAKSHQKEDGPAMEQPSQDSVTKAVQVEPAAGSHAASDPQHPLQNLDQSTNASAQFSESAAYLSAVRTQIQRHVRYPDSLKNQHISGIAQLTLSVASTGKLVDVSLEATSGFAELDRLALKAVREAAPFPSFTAAMQNQLQIRLKLPIEFRLR